MFSLHEIRTNWCQKWDLHRMTTRAASKLEDQLTVLLEKMDKQSEQLQNLTRQQSE